EADDPLEAAAAAPPNSKMQALAALMRALRGRARAATEGRRTIGGQSGRVLELIGDRLPPSAPFAAIGSNIATRAHLRTLVRSPRTFVLGIPTAYARFRRDANRDGQHYRGVEETAEFISGARISPEEVDVLLLAMLRNTRRLLQHDRRRLDFATPHNWLE